AILTSPAWPRTLLIYTYDEHGGYYDHVAPPEAIPPDDIGPKLTPGDAPGDYDMYGPRVPAIVVSPYSKPNGVSNRVYDHTSILATIEAKWNLPALTSRDANASTVMDFLDPAVPAFLAPPTIQGPTQTGPSGPVGPPTPATGGAPPAPEQIRLGTLGGASNDRFWQEDQLNFQGYIDAFAALFTSPHTEPPLTIGIYGSWGMGKSFLLHNIEGSISDPQKEEARQQLGASRVHVVTVNAWMYFATESVLPSLVHMLVNSLEKAIPWPWYVKWANRLRLNLPQLMRKLRVPLTAVCLVVAAAVITGIVQNRAGLGAAVGGAIASLGVGGLLTAASGSLTPWVKELFSDDEYGKETPVMAKIREDLVKLERRLHPNLDAREPANRRILILIDDLDRCEPDKVVQTLQAVNLLLDFPSFIVCLGIDARIITAAVEQHYGELLRHAGASGYEYLDKIVQIPFRIPEPTAREIEVFIGDRLDNPLPQGDVAGTGQLPADSNGGATQTDGTAAPAEPTEQVAGGQGNPSDREQQNAQTPAIGGESEGAVAFTYVELRAFQNLAPYLRRNPRHLKRLINVYRLVRLLAQGNENDPLILEKPGQTVAWLVMWSQWPYTAQMMLQLFDTTDRSSEGAEGGKSGTLLYLFEGVASRIDHETAARFDDDHDRLRALLEEQLSEITWEQVPRIHRYTVNFNPAVEEELRTAGARASDQAVGTP
ncbi:MAG: KAP family P-loop NTPase fold protein, partial [Steroidobacteraceae bacterium]